MEIHIKSTKEICITKIINLSQENYTFVLGTLSNITSKNNKIAKIISYY